MNKYSQNDSDNDEAYKEESWHGDENIFEHIDEYGFEDKQYEKVEVFENKNYEIAKLNKNEHRIKKIAFSNPCIVIYTEAGKIMRWKPREFSLLDHNLPEIKEEATFLGAPANMIYNVMKKLPFGEEKKQSLSIDRILMDPTGFHTFLCSNQGENFYFNLRADKIKHCLKLKGYCITSIAWDENGTEDSTREILLGTYDGSILLFKLDFQIKTNDILEANVKSLVILPINPGLPNSGKCIRNLEFITLAQSNNSKTTFVIATTVHSIFCFSGASNFEILFDKYNNEQAVRKTEIPFPSRSGESLMNIYYSRTDMGSRAHSFIFTNGSNIAFFKFPERNERTDVTDFMNKPQSLKYIKKMEQEDKVSYAVQEMPIAIALTEFHYFLLHTDMLTIISRITEKVVAYFEFPKLQPMLGMSYDRLRDDLWVYSAKGIQQISIKNEDKDAWKLYVETNKYKEAYEICKKYKSSYTEYVIDEYQIGGLYAEQLITQKKYVDAAKMFVETNKNFEEISLKFIMNEGAEEGYEVYLQLLLDKLRPEDKPQRTMILSILTELKLYKLNKLDKSDSKYSSVEVNKQKEQKLKFDEANLDFTQFIDKNLNDFDETTMYQLTQSHGRFQNFVMFARKKKMFEYIIIHHLNEEQYEKAISNLKNMKDESFNTILYRYCHIFMRHEPEAIIQLLKSLKHKFEPTKLIAGLMDIPFSKRKIGIDFLKYCIDTLKCKEKSIFNILIFFLSEQEDLTELYEFLKVQEMHLHEHETLYFDLNFALRIFKKPKNIVKAQIHVYGMMGLYSEAVHLALENGNIDDAKIYANKPENDDTKKKLWLQIAIHLFGKGSNIDQVISLTKDTQLVKIEDLLPYFNENIKIDHFKEEICNSLNEYNSKIEDLKAEMEGYSLNAEQLKNELRNLKNKYLVINSNQKCDECYKSIFLEEFYIFPCMHGFHKECLLRKIAENPIEKQKMNEIEEVNNKINNLISKASSNPNQKRESKGNTAFFFFNLFGARGGSEKGSAQLSLEEEKYLKEYKERYDFLLANECLNCGNSIIESIYMSFDPDDSKKKSWEIKKYEKPYN